MIAYPNTFFLPGPAASVFQSVWTYVILVALFGAVLILISFYILRKTSSEEKPYRTPKSPSSAPSHSPLKESEITSLILSVKDSPRKVLFAAAGLTCMPVTVPIRAAVRLAAEDQKCLLIDLDTKRDAVARVFNLQPANPPSFEPVKTDIEHIHVIAAHVFANTNTMNIQSLVKASETKYNVILVSAPYLDGHPDRKQISACVDKAILFAQTPSQLERLRDICKASRCKILGSFKTEPPSED